MIILDFATKSQPFINILFKQKPLDILVKMTKTIDAFWKNNQFIAPDNTKTA